MSDEHVMVAVESLVALADEIARMPRPTCLILNPDRLNRYRLQVLRWAKKARRQERMARKRRRGWA